MTKAARGWWLLLRQEVLRLLHRLAALLHRLLALHWLALLRLLLVALLLHRLLALLGLLLVALLRLLHWLTLRRLLLVAALLHWLALLLHRLPALWLLLEALLRLAALWHTAATLTEYRGRVEATAAELLARRVLAGVDSHAVKAGRDPLRLVVVVPRVNDNANRLALVNQLAVLHRVGEHLARFVVNVRHAVR